MLKTDQFQSIIILLFFINTLYNLINYSNFKFSIDILWADIDGVSGYSNPLIINILNYISAFLFVYFALLLYPDFWFRNITTLSKKEDSKKAIYFSFPLIILLVLLPSYIGLNANLAVPHPGGVLNYNFDAITSIILSFIKDASGFFLLISALLCASLTTIDSLIITLIQVFFTDIYNIKTKKENFLVRYITILFSVIITICTASFFVGKPSVNHQNILSNLFSWPILGVILGSIIIYPGYLLLFQLVTPKRLKQTVIANKERFDIIIGISLYSSFVLGAILSILNHIFADEIRLKIGEIWHPLIPTLLFPFVMMTFLLFSLNKLSVRN